MADMAIDKNDNFHVVYYNEQMGSFKPVYQFISVNYDQFTISDPKDIATESTSSDFSRPDDYFTIKVDTNVTEQLFWTDGRDDEIDIYYAQKMSGIQPELTRIEPISVIIGLASIDIYKSSKKVKR